MEKAKQILDAQDRKIQGHLYTEGAIREILEDKIRCAEIKAKCETSLREDWKDRGMHAAGKEASQSPDTMMPFLLEMVKKELLAKHGISPAADSALQKHALREYDDKAIEMEIKRLIGKDDQAVLDRIKDMTE